MFGLNSVRKKVLLLSKLVGGTIVLFYIFTVELPAGNVFSFWLYMALMTIVILSVDLILGRLISKPLVEINEAARQMAALNFDVQCNLHTKDEFGELSDSLNVMSSNLQDALDKLEMANVRLEQDVEHEKLLLAQRKELTETLSHEMKTPLGLIHAYAEGLKDETDEGKKRQYMDSIISATDRMNTIIVSLLDLSAMEAGAAIFSEERFDFIELAETVAGRLLIDTPEADYTFTYELPDDKVFICADKKRIEQVLENLIGNAKKHVCAGGSIHLRIARTGETLSFSIYNQGKAVSEQELPHIWEKFYKGENTLSGSSGLGLAIVSQILSIYNTPYGVKTHQNGMQFYFQFPTVL